MFRRRSNGGRRLRELVDLLARYKSGRLSLSRACSKAAAVNERAARESDGAVISPPGDLQAEDFGHMLLDVIARCKAGEVDRATASQEAFLIRSVIGMLRPAGGEKAAVAASCRAEEPPDGDGVGPLH